MAFENGPPAENPLLSRVSKRISSAPIDIDSQSSAYPPASAEHSLGHCTNRGTWRRGRSDTAYGGIAPIGSPAQVATGKAAQRKHFTGRVNGTLCARHNARRGLGNGLGEISDSATVALLIRVKRNDRRISLIVIPDAQLF